MTVQETKRRVFKKEPQACGSLTSCLPWEPNLNLRQCNVSYLLMNGSSSKQCNWVTHQIFIGHLHIVLPSTFLFKCPQHMIIPVLDSSLRVATPNEIGGWRLAYLLETQHNDVTIKGVRMRDVVTGWSGLRRGTARKRCPRSRTVSLRRYSKCQPAGWYYLTACTHPSASPSHFAGSSWVHWSPMTLCVSRVLYRYYSARSFRRTN